VLRILVLHKKKNLYIKLISYINSIPSTSIKVSTIAFVGGDSDSWVHNIIYDKQYYGSYYFLTGTIKLDNESPFKIVIKLFLNHFFFSQVILLLSK